MRSNDSLKLLHRSLELIQESQNLRWRALETISATTAVIGRSRSLLSAKPVSGVRDRGWGRYTAVPHVQAERHLSTPKEADPKPSPDAGSALERIADRDFLGETVSLDGRHFVDCNLSTCVLEYAGGPCILEGTQFTGCRFLFGNEAAMTVAMLECFGLVEQHVANATLPPPGSTSGKSRVN